MADNLLIHEPPPMTITPQPIDNPLANEPPPMTITPENPLAHEPPPMTLSPINIGTTPMVNPPSLEGFNDIGFPDTSPLDIPTMKPPQDVPLPQYPEGKRHDTPVSPLPRVHRRGGRIQLGTVRSGKFGVVSSRIVGGTAANKGHQFKRTWFV